MDKEIHNQANTDILNKAIADFICSLKFPKDYVKMFRAVHRVTAQGNNMTWIQVEKTLENMLGYYPPNSNYRKQYDAIVHTCPGDSIFVDDVEYIRIADDPNAHQEECFLVRGTGKVLHASWVLEHKRRSKHEKEMRKKSGNVSCATIYMPDGETRQLYLSERALQQLARASAGIPTPIKDFMIEKKGDGYKIKSTKEESEC